MTALANASRAAFFVILMAASSCQQAEEASDRPRHVDEEDQVSFEIPKGFRVERDRDAWVLVGESDLSRINIAIRSVELDGWSEERTPEMVLPATKTALIGLPAAKVSGPVEGDHPAYREFDFDVVFEPRSRHGEKYERLHSVLFADRRVIHVLLTAPVGRLEKGRTEFERVLKSVREEG